MPQGDVDVRHTQNEAGWLVANFGNERELRNNERLELVLNEIDLRFCEWHKSPVLSPRLIVNFTKPPAFIADILKVRRTNNGGTARIETCGKSSQMRDGFGRIGEPPRVPILRFGKAASLDQALIVRRIVRGQYGGRKLESIDQQGTDVIG